MMTHIWQSSLFALVAGLLTLTFRRNSANVRYWIWLSASLKFLLPFELLVGLGRELKWELAIRTITVPEVPMATLTQQFPGSVSYAGAESATVAWIPIAILGLWACGFAAIILIRLRSWFRIRAALRASTSLDISAVVSVRSSAGLLEPGVVGFIRPVVLLPDGIVERLTPSQLETVLTHELCHVRRRDNLFAAIHMIVEALFWFHPLVWWIGARLVEERERACDEDVLSRGSEPRIYADAILSVCRLFVESPLGCVSGVTGSNIKRRIEAIMTNQTRQGLNRAKKFLLATAGIAAVAGPVAIGMAIGVGHPQFVQAQTPVSIPLMVEATQAAPVAADPMNVAMQTTAPAPALSVEHRLAALLFDFATMTPAEQLRARQSAIEFVHNRKPGDRVAIFAVTDGRAAVVQDFTERQDALIAAVLKLNSTDGTSPSPSVTRSLAGIESAANLLAVLPEKKSLVYFSNGLLQPGPDHQAEFQSAIDAAKRSNVALYPVDVRGLAPQLIGQAQAAPASPPADAQTKFGSAPAEMKGVYARYGAPDQIEDHSLNAQSPSQIWRYNYLESFHSNVEFEFTPGKGHYSARINWPPPLATYESTPNVAADAIVELPGRHGSLRIYPATEFQILSVPLDSLSGPVELSSQIKTRPDSGATGRPVAAMTDHVQAAAGTYQANFILREGSYVCSLTVREQATGHTYAETINFEVR